MRRLEDLGWQGHQSLSTQHKKFFRLRKPVDRFHDVYKLYKFQKTFPLKRMFGNFVIVFLEVISKSWEWSGVREGEQKKRNILRKRGRERTGERLDGRDR